MLCCCDVGIGNAIGHHSLGCFGMVVGGASEIVVLCLFVMLGVIWDGQCHWSGDVLGWLGLCRSQLRPGVPFNTGPDLLLQ